VAIRFYVDADLIGLGKLLVQVRTDVTHAGDPGGIGIDKKERPPSPVQPGALDVDWIPIVAANRWIVITRDRHMRSRPAEERLIREASARHVRIEGSPIQRKLRKWDQLGILVGQWRGIERLVDEPGPWIYVASRTRLRKEM
jgi:PIN like domain